MAGEDATVRVGWDDRKLKLGLSRTQRAAKNWARGVATDIKRGLSGAMSSAGGLAGLGGLAALTVATRDVMQFEKRVVRLGIATKTSVGDLGKFKAQIMAVSKATGADQNSLLGAMETFVALTGDMQIATGSMGTFAQIAQASGADISDIATAAAALTTNFKIAAPEMEKAFSILITQGEKGAVELKDMAGLLAGLTPKFSMFSASGTSGLAELGALLQVARQGFGDASEAATGLTAVMTSLTDSETLGRLEQVAGVKAFTVGADGVAKMRDLADIVFETIEALKGDPIKLSEIFGRKEAVAGMLKFGQAGRGTFETLRREGEKSAAVQENFARYSESTAAAMERSKAAMGAAWNELIARNIDSIASAFKRITEMLKWIADHPEGALLLAGAFKGLGGAASFGLAMADAAGGSGGAGTGRSGGGRGTPGAGKKGTEIARNVEAARARSAARWNAGATGAGMAQRGLAGYMLADSLGSNSTGLDRASVTFTAALSAIPGPLGLLAGAATAASIGLQHVADQAQEKYTKRIETATWGDYGKDRIHEYQKTGDLSSGLYLRRKAKEAGALTGEGMDTKIDEDRLYAALENDPMFDGMGKQEKRNAILNAVYATKSATWNRKVADASSGKLKLAAGEGVLDPDAATGAEGFVKPNSGVLRDVTAADLARAITLLAKGLNINLDVKDGKLVEAAENGRQNRRP